MTPFTSDKPTRLALVAAYRCEGQRLFASAGRVSGAHLDMLHWRLARDIAHCRITLTSTNGIAAMSFHERSIRRSRMRA